MKRGASFRMTSLLDAPEVIEEAKQDDYGFKSRLQFYVPKLISAHLNRFDSPQTDKNENKAIKTDELLRLYLKVSSELLDITQR